MLSGGSAQEADTLERGIEFQLRHAWADQRCQHRGEVLLSVGKIDNLKRGAVDRIAELEEFEVVVVGVGPVFARFTGEDSVIAFGAVLLELGLSVSNELVDSLAITADRPHSDNEGGELKEKANEAVDQRCVIHGKSYFVVLSHFYVLFF